MKELCYRFNIFINYSFLLVDCYSIISVDLKLKSMKRV